MSKCYKINDCPFHKGRLANYSSAVLESIKRQYCEEDQSLCARYMVLTTLGEKYVPKDLPPNDLDTAQSIIREHQDICLTQKIKIPD